MKTTILAGILVTGTMLTLTGAVPRAPAASPRTAKQNANPIRRLIEVEPGVNIEVLDWGGTGRPIVLVPGYGRTAQDFATFGPALSARYHAYSVSRRGFGGSSKPDHGYSADRLADDVLAVMDSLGIRAPILAGHSLGGEELSSIGSRHPEKVSGLVYLDAGYGYAFYDTQSREDKERIDRNEVIRGLQQLVEVAEQGNAEEAHRLMSRLLGTDLPALQRTLQGMQARIPTASSNPRQGFSMRLTPGVDRMVFEGLQRYTSVRAPVLAIYALKGNNDPAVVSAWRAGSRHEIVALRQAAPQARVVILPGASHDVFRSNEGDVLREIAAFIAFIEKK